MNERIGIYARNPIVTLAGGGVVGAAIGATAMYLHNKRSIHILAKEMQILCEEYEELKKDRFLNKQALARTVNETHEAMRHLRNLGVTVLSNLDDMAPGDHPEIVIERIVQPTDQELASFSYDGNEVIGHVLDVRETDGGIEADIELTEEGSELIRRNIFDDANDNWDYELERSSRTKENPYVIHADEFNADEFGWSSQTTLTWYEGDQILTDSNDVPIYNPHTVVGELRWGHGSGDPNVVYIRNERLQAEYEVLRDEGSYEIIVLGGIIEEEYDKTDLKHSKHPLKFRED